MTRRDNARVSLASPPPDRYGTAASRYTLPSCGHRREPLGRAVFLAAKNLRQTLLEQPARRHGDRLGLSDDQMVQHPDPNQPQRLSQFAGDGLIRRARFGNAAGMVVRENHRRSVMPKARTHHFPWMHARTIDGPGTQIT